VSFERGFKSWNSALGLPKAWGRGRIRSRSAPRKVRKRCWVIPAPGTDETRPL